MTARTLLNRRMRWIGGLIYAGFGLFIASILVGVITAQPPNLAVSLPGFALAFVAGMAAQYGALRCPQCRGNLGVLLMQRGLHSVDRRVHFCPYCGCSLDDELTAEGCVESPH